MSRWRDESEDAPLAAAPTGDEFLDRTHYCSLHGYREYNGSHAKVSEWDIPERFGRRSDRG